MSTAVDMPSAWLGPFTHQSPVNHGHGLTAGPAEGKNREEGFINESMTLDGLKGKSLGNRNL